MEAFKREFHLKQRRNGKKWGPLQLCMSVDSFCDGGDKIGGKKKIRIA